MCNTIPQDPTRPEYRQGDTLGDEHKHWFRAKFFQQYRLFFRFHAQAKVIVFAWGLRVNRGLMQSSQRSFGRFVQYLEQGLRRTRWTAFALLPIPDRV